MFNKPSKLQIGLLVFLLLSVKEKCDLYKINFDNVSAKEFISFVSRISDTNIIFEEEDLKFNITVISEVETTVSGILSATTQILRIHGLTLIEEESNLIIHKNPDVGQIPSIETKDNSAITTKIFQIHEGDTSNIASIIVPMISKNALVEVSTDTRQIVVTDVPSSIDTISQIILSLDVSDTTYSIFYPKNLLAEQLVKVAKEILISISPNVHVELVPQESTNTIFVISNPTTIEKSKTLLNDLDQEISYDSTNNLSANHILPYNIGGRSPEETKELMKELLKIGKIQGLDSPELWNTVSHAKYIPAINSLIFVGEEKDLSTISTVISIIEENNKDKQLYIYVPQHIDKAEFLLALKEISEDLKRSYGNNELIEILSSAEILKHIDGIIFIGNSKIVAEVKEIIEVVENSNNQNVETSIYNVKFSRYELEKSIHQINRSFKNQENNNHGLVSAIDSMIYIPSANSFFFNGTKEANQDLQSLLLILDKAQGNTLFTIYTPTQLSPQHIMKYINEIKTNLESSNLEDAQFVQVLNNARIIHTSDQLIFTGSQDALSKITKILTELDSTSLADLNSQGPFFLHVTNQDFTKIQEVFNELHKSISTANSLREAISNIKWIKSANLLVISGSAEAFQKIKEIVTLTSKEEEEISFVNLSNKDAKEVAQYLVDTGKILGINNENSSLTESLLRVQALPISNTVVLRGSTENISKMKDLIKDEKTDNKEIFIYKIKHLKPETLKHALLGIVKHTHTNYSQLSFSAINHAVEHMRIINESNIQFVGTKETLAGLKSLLNVVDTADHPHAVTTNNSASILVYKIKYLPHEEILAHLEHVVNNGGKKSKLQDTIKTARYIPTSNSLIFSGTNKDLDKLENLITQIDILPIQTEEEQSQQPHEYYQRYIPRHVEGNDLINMLKHFNLHLSASGIVNNNFSDVVQHLRYVDSSNTIIVRGNPTIVNQVLELLKEFDSNEEKPKQNQEIKKLNKTEFLIHKLQNQSGPSMVDALKTIYSDLPNNENNKGLISTLQSVKYMSSTNSILASGNYESLLQLKNLIVEIDKPLKQVFIEVLVLETSSNYELDFGLRWGNQGSLNNKFSWNMGNFQPSDGGNENSFASGLNQIDGSRIPTGSDISPLSGGFMGVIGDIVWHQGKSYSALGSLANAVKTDSDTVVILSQKIVVQDNQNAKIFSGDNVPFTGSVVTTTGTAQTTNANLEYRNVGVTLDLTPVIGDDNFITIDINEEISEEPNQGNELDNTITPGVNGIRTSKTSMQTKIRMPDRHFLILSGTMRNQNVRTVSGIPCLGALPLVGAAFSETRKVSVNRNVLIFVKPHIIKSDVQYANITEGIREMFKDKSNKEDFDEDLDSTILFDDSDE